MLLQKRPACCAAALALAKLARTRPARPAAHAAAACALSVVCVQVLMYLNDVEEGGETCEWLCCLGWCCAASGVAVLHLAELCAAVAG